MTIILPFTVLQTTNNTQQVLPTLVAKPHNWATFDPVLRATNCVLQIAEPITVNGTAGKHANFPRNGINISEISKIINTCKIDKYFWIAKIYKISKILIFSHARYFTNYFHPPWWWETWNGFFFKTNFLSKNVYNDVLCLNGSKVTALNIFQTLNVSCALKQVLNSLIDNINQYVWMVGASYSRNVQI